MLSIMVLPFSQESPIQPISIIKCLINFFQVRHGPGFYNCKLTMELSEDGSEDVAVVNLSEDDQGLAAGQFAAFYHDKTCVGSGVILESWDDQGFPVCAKALEIARMEDKSKLGKPVKIKVKPEIALNETDYGDGNELDSLLVKSQRALSIKKRLASQGAISKFPVSWMQKLRDKWSQMF